MSTEIDFSKLSDKEFAEQFSMLLELVNEDPIENFVKNKLFMDFTPTPAQVVALKCVFGKKLDKVIKYSIKMETKDAEGNFLLEDVLMTEVEMYEFMTDSTYLPQYQTEKNRINFILGRRAGKCQHIDSFVTLADGSRVKIGTLIGKAFEVWSYNETTGKRELSRASCVDNGTKPVYRIKTRSGFELDRTDNHPVMTEHGWKTVSNGLKVGDSLQSPRKNVVFGEQNQYTDDHFKILGLLIGDGSVSSGNLKFTQMPGVVLDEFLDIVTKTFKGKTTEQKQKSKAKEFNIASVELRNFLREVDIYGKTSHTKVVPNCIYTAPKNQVALFLNRLFACDGTLYLKEDKRVVFEYCSASKELAQGVKHLLQRFGVIATLRQKQVKYKRGRNLAYILSTSDYSTVETLMQEIGILGKDIRFIKKINQKQTTNHETSLMPKIYWEKIAVGQRENNFTDLEVVYGKNYKCTSRDFGRLRKQYCPNRYKVLKYFENLQVTGKEKTIVEDYWFDKIVSIEYLGELPTAGLTVEKNHTYINDVVEHNTTISAILAIYCAIKINWKPFLRKTPAATVAVLSHTIEFSEEILELIKQFIEESPILSRLIDANKKNTKSTFNLRVPFIETSYGKRKIVHSRVTVKVGTASKRTIRGKAICALLCDEIAFWNLDEKAAERDEDILRAATPSLLQFGKHSLLLKLSSPGIKQGVLYDEYNKKDNLPKNYINFKAPSWVWNNILDRQEFANQYLLDPTGFDCEYRANFVDSISNFILPERIDLCTQRGITFNPPEAKSVDVVYGAALDAAFKGDRFAFTVLGYDGTRIKQYVIKSWEGTRQNPVQAHEVAAYIKTTLKEFKINRISADQYAFQPLKEIFEQYGLVLEETTFTNTYKKKIYFNLKRFIHSLNMDILDNPLLIKELKQLQVEQSTTGTVKIGHMVGGHDDSCACTAIAAFQLTEQAGNMRIADDSEIAGSYEEEVAKDLNGIAFNSPTTNMVADMMGMEYQHNLQDYEFNPETGKYEKVVDSEEDSGDGSDVIF